MSNNLQTMFSTQARKAYIAAAIAGTAAATLAVVDGLTVTEWLTIAGAVLVAFQATYWTTNADAQVNPQAVDYVPGLGLSKPDGGYQLVEMAFAFLIIIIAVVLILRFIH